MKPLVAQAATGALVGAVGLALALLPGRLLKPEGAARPLGLPQTQAVSPVEAAAPIVHRHRAAKPAHKVVPQTGFASLASVRTSTPVFSPAPAPAAAARPVTHRAARHAAPAPVKRPVHHPRVFVEPARPPAPAPTPAPATPPVPTATAAAPELTATPAPDPTRTLASDASNSSTTPTSTVPTPPPPGPPTPTPGGGKKGNGDNGDGHDHGHKHGG